MRKSVFTGTLCGAVVCAVCVAAQTVFASSALLRFDDCRLMEAAVNDGDSFRVSCSNLVIHARLYYIDCPETEMQTDTGARRVRAQMRYFGLSNAVEVLHYGEHAAAFTRKKLNEPFTVHTAFAGAPGGYGSGRKYIFITCADGKDLGMLLVQSGLARAYGIGRAGPRGASRDELEARLADEEMSAAIRREGIWSLTDADRIAELRAEQRAEERALEHFKLGLRDRIEYPLDINRAASAELQTIPGIGPVTAGRIIDGRPYANVHDLLRVHGIGAKTLEAVLDYIAVTNSATTD